MFAKPWEEDQPFPEFLDYVTRQETDSAFPSGSEIRYAQTRQCEPTFPSIQAATPNKLNVNQRMTISAMSTSLFSAKCNETYPSRELRWRKTPTLSICGEQSNSKSCLL